MECKLSRPEVEYGVKTIKNRKESLSEDYQGLKKSVE